MILLILFYLAVVVIAGILVTLGFVFYLKNRRLSAPEDQRINLYPPHPEVYRPLFAPSREDIHALEKADEKADLDRKKDEERVTAEQRSLRKVEAARKFLVEWEKAPDRKTLGELLLLSTETQKAEIYSEISRNVIQIWQDNKIDGLTAADLAALLDSHFRLLPQQEMASGASFWLKQEIAALRRESNEKA